MGKVIMMEILGFLKNNPNLATGVAIGAALGALVGFIPFLGPMLAPLLAAAGSLLGGLAGARLDRSENPGQGYAGIIQEVIIVVRKFIELVASIARALKDKRKNQ